MSLKRRGKGLNYNAVSSRKRVLDVTQCKVPVREEGGYSLQPGEAPDQLGLCSHRYGAAATSAAACRQPGPGHSLAAALQHSRLPGSEFSPIDIRLPLVMQRGATVGMLGVRWESDYSSAARSVQHRNHSPNWSASNSHYNNTRPLILSAPNIASWPGINIEEVTATALPLPIICFELSSYIRAL